MAEELHNYKIKENLFKKSFLFGLTVEGIDKLACVKEEFRHVFISGAIDGIEEDAKWGRLRFFYELSEDMVITVYALAVNGKMYEEFLYDPNKTILEKRKFFEKLEAVKAVNKNDLLLYEQNGRYLYLMIDIMGMGEGNISEIQVNNKGDICMETFPEVYREYGSFFHRYLSIFSSIYLDFQKEINYVDKLLDLDEAPKELLPILAHWMGVDVSGDFLEEKRLRLLVKEAYQLNKMKGTKAALERLTEIVLGEKAIILEKNVFRNDTQTEDMEIYESLYGDKPYDVTMLIKSYVPENQKSQLMFLINQFKPIRCRLLIHFLEGRGELDSHAYMDMNAQIQELEVGGLDERISMDGMILMEE